MKYTTRIYFSGFITRSVEADSEEEAIRKGRGEVISNEVISNLKFVKPTALHTIPEVIEIIDTLELWTDADTAELEA
jgi:hypothetical protein